MGHHHHRTDDGRADEDDQALAELLDLDAEVLHTYLSEVTEWVRTLAEGRSPRRVLDLGAGTGTGTVALAQRFPGAEVVAVDSSEQMLSRVRSKALGLGLADRLVTVLADLDTTWPVLEPVDVAWASMSLHHLSDPDRVLRDILAALRPGGLVAAVEMDADVRFLPDDIGVGRPGLEARCHAALAEETATSLPHLGSDWGQRLTQAGFVSMTQRTFTIDLVGSVPAATGRYAYVSFRHMRPVLEGRLAVDDLAAVDTIIDGDGPEALLRRDDLHVRGRRTAWVAYRP